MLTFFEQRFGVQNANLMFLGRANFSVVAVMIRSARPDSVVDTISAERRTLPINAAERGQHWSPCISLTKSAALICRRC